MLSLLDHGYAVTIIDNLDNAYEEAYRRMQELAGGKAANMKFIKVHYSEQCWILHSPTGLSLQFFSASCLLSNSSKCSATCSIKAHERLGAGA